MTERILVVDDEELIRETVSSMLISANYSCQVCSSGTDALRMLEQDGPFELVLCDLMMTDLDGVGLLERTKGKYPDMPVVMVTAVHDISVALAAIRNGAYDYLLKPFEREQLLSTVSRALENRRLRVKKPAYYRNLDSLVKARTQQLQSAMANLEPSYDVTLEALGDALDLKEAETEGHSRRVTLNTIAIAQALGLPREQIAVIARGAFLHDIGKMAIPDAVLRKPGRLNAEETKIMQEHPYRGYVMLQKIPFLREATEIVWAHHENFDGTGYPRGLKGEEITLGARIAAIANTLDSITSDLPYRPAQSLKAAREEIRRWSGRQFDPDIAKVFLEMPDKIWEDLRSEFARPAP